MGNTCIANPKDKRRKISGDELPEGTEALKGLKLPMIDFELKISNIQLKHPPPGLIGLRLDIDGIMQWKYEKVKTADIISWKTEKQTRIKVTEYELRNMFLNIRVLNSEGVQVGVLTLNMFLISTGPSKHDFLIKYHEGHLGRLIADIKCTQLIQLEMKTVKVQLNFLNQHPGQMFHFTIRTEDLNQNFQQSFESYDVQTFLYNKKRTYEIDSQGQSATYKKRKTMILENKKGLQWSNSISQRAYNKQLPCFQLPVKVNSISNYSFQFILWKKNKEDNDTFQSYGESNIPLAKLFWTDIKGSNLNPQIGGVRQIQIEQQIQFMGRRCGNMSFRCKVTTPKFFQQVFILTRTELGMIQLRSQSAQKFIQCDYLRKIKGLKQNIFVSLIKAGNLKNQLTEKAINQGKQVRNNIYEDILKLQKFFLQGRQSAPIFEYCSQEDMIKSQAQMIDIIQKFIPLTQLRQVCISEASWRCLRIILLRGQFLLSKIGFTQDEIISINSTFRSKMKKSLQQKIQLCQTYQGLLLRLLKMSLQKFGRKLLQEQSKFILTICTIAYFKLPQFRQDLLNTINPKDNESKVFCYDKFYNKQSFTKLIDWQNKFSKPLQTYGVNKILIEDLKSINHWKRILQKKSTYFFVFIETFMNQSNKILGLPQINKSWNLIHGYDIIVGSFLQEMKRRRIIDYPDALKDTNMSMLSNECLLPIFMKILIQKTNTFQINSTLKCLELIGAYFAYFQYNKQNLPSCFDSKLFYVAVKIIFISQNCFTTAKILQIIYQNFNIFNNQFRRQISMLLFGRSFFNLILNWGKVVRHIFRYLIMYRILIWAKQKQAADVLSRWDLLLSLLQDAELSQMKINKESLCISHRKHYHQKMKSKLNNKRRYYDQDFCLQRRTKSQIYDKNRVSQILSPMTQIGNDRAFQQWSQNQWKNVSQRKVKFSQQIDLQSSESIGIGMRKKSDTTDIKSTRQRRVSFYSDFEVSGISKEQQAYLQCQKIQMIKLIDEYQNWENTRKNTDDIPIVQIKVPLDQGDIRPQQQISGS